VVTETAIGGSVITAAIGAIVGATVVTETAIGASVMTAATGADVTTPEGQKACAA
jgi:hypothetical protein